jgi:uncharacterized Zn finger protein
MAYYDGFPAYVSVAEKRLKAQKSVEKLKKKNPDICPVILTGTKLTKTWWGKAWNDNLESYSDFANRIGRGRSYVRHGAVVDLKITQGEIKALVQGSAAKPYQVTISILPLSEAVWQEITRNCAGKLDSLQELIVGKFPKTLSEVFTAKGKGLFPTSKEIRLQCSCPDGANMCKHVAAVFYGVGARLDEDPALFFVLRNVKMEDLISEAISQKTETFLKKSNVKSRRIIADTDIADLFGIEMETKPEMKREKKKRR